MTVDAALVRLVFRPFPLVDGDTDFIALTAQAKERLDQDDPGLSTLTYDRCHALMIAHMYQMGDPEMALRSSSGGDFSSSKDPGVTAALLEYRSTIESALKAAQNAATTDLSAVTRSDAVMPDLQLDDAEVSRYI